MAGMELEPKLHAYLTGDRTSFAFISARDRWPVILTGAIDDMHRAVASCPDEPKASEGKSIVRELAELKYNLQHDRALQPLADDGEPDVAEYNKELESFASPSWFNIPWLYGECYLYRRMNTLFSLSEHWKTYDVFSKQKMSTFRSSRPAVLELAARYREICGELAEGKAQSTKEAEELLFREMCEICLWGNATDLSLLTSLTYEDIQKLQGSEARKASEEKILVNDLPAAFEALQKTKAEERRVDIILDNAGFELFVDLILAGYLLSAGLATQVVLHPKSIPWFVSDVLPGDFALLLNALADPQAFYTTLTDDDKHLERQPQPLSEKEIEDLQFLFKSWSGFHAEGQLIIRPNRFWTHSGSYRRMPVAAPKLWEDLKSSELVIFKGDLNYRKITGDVAWEPTTPFSTAIGSLGEGSGVRTLALRTCKADVVVGLEPGVDERLKAMEGGGGDSGCRKWAWSGKWAVVQFCDGKA